MGKKSARSFKLKNRGGGALGLKAVSLALTGLLVLNMVPFNIWADTADDEQQAATSENQPATSDENATADDQSPKSDDQGGDKEDKTTKSDDSSANQGNEPAKKDDTSSSSSDKAKASLDWTVKFHGNAKGVAEHDYSMTAGVTKTIALSNRFHRTGFTFKGWSTEKGQGKKVVYADGIQMADPPHATMVEVYAQWAPNATVKVTFDGNYATKGSAPAAQSASAGSAITIPGKGDLERTDYTFLGWSMFRDVVPGERIFTEGDSFTVPEGGATLYARWKDQGFPYRVVELHSRFAGDKQDETYKIMCSTKKSVDGAMQVKIPEASTYLPTRPGYSFQNWSASSKASGIAFQPGQWVPVKNSKDAVSFYAQWKQNDKATVNFDANGARGFKPYKIVKPFGSEIILPNQKALERPGYTFGGWSQSGKPGATDKIYAAGETFVVPQDGATLYAVWNVNENSTVVFDANGAQGFPPYKVIKPYGSEINLPNQKALVRAGYSFGGWCENAAGHGKIYAPKDTYVLPQGGATLYAVWNAEQQHVTYIGNAGGACTGHQPYTYGKTDKTVSVSKCTFKLDGFAFKSWNTKADGTGQSYQMGGKFKLGSSDDSNVLYAQWKAEDRSLILDPNCLSSSAKISEVAGVTGQQVKVPVGKLRRNGYTFIGWNTEADGSGTAYGMGGLFTLKADKDSNVLYAQWRANSDLALTFVANGGYGEQMSPIKGSTGESVTVSECSYRRDGYTFSGWANADGSIWQPGMSYTLSADASMNVLYAQWKADEQSLRFDANAKDAKGSMDQIVGVTDGTVTIPANGFTRSGFDFIGWNTKSDGTGHAFAAGESFTLGANASGNVLYAQWKSSDDGHGAGGDTGGKDAGRKDASKTPKKNGSIPGTGDVAGFEAAAISAVALVSAGAGVVMRRRRQS